MVIQALVIVDARSSVRLRSPLFNLVSRMRVRGAGGQAAISRTYHEKNERLTTYHVLRGDHVATGFCNSSRLISSESLKSRRTDPFQANGHGWKGTTYWRSLSFTTHEAGL